MGLPRDCIWGTGGCSVQILTPATWGHPVPAWGSQREGAFPGAHGKSGVVPPAQQGAIRGRGLRSSWEPLQRMKKSVFPPALSFLPAPFSLGGSGRRRGGSGA